MEDLISVIVPIYNVEKYLEKCVNSILAQTYKNLEIILVDDGSTDSSPEICEKFKKIDDRIIVIHKKNGGLSSARNAGLDVAKGKYFGFVDSDDYIDEKMYEKLHDSMLKTGADLVVCDFQYVDENYNAMPDEGRVHVRDEVLEGENVFPILNEARTIQYSISVTKLYKRELFDNLRFKEGFYHEDGIILHHIYYRCKKVAFISDALYFYFCRTGSIMGLTSPKKKYDRFYEYYDRLIFLHKTKIKVCYKRTLDLAYMHARNYIVCGEVSKDKEFKKNLYNLVKWMHFSPKALYMLFTYYIKVLQKK